jgi:hypothetical protein
MPVRGGEIPDIAISEARDSAPRNLSRRIEKHFACRSHARQPASPSSLECDLFCAHVFDEASRSSGLAQVNPACSRAFAPHSSSCCGRRHGRYWAGLWLPPDRSWAHRARALPHPPPHRGRRARPSTRTCDGSPAMDRHPSRSKRRSTRASGCCSRLPARTPPASPNASARSSRSPPS